MLEPILYFASTVVATMIVAVLLCRYRRNNQRQVSWGTVVASSVIANAAVLIGMALYEEGWNLFTREAWIEPKGGWAGVIIVLSVISVFCVLPAVGVAVYYQRRSERDETQLTYRSWWPPRQ